MQAQRAALIAYVQTQLVPRVTAASVDPRLPQRSLSERLANVGVLPMFGFPTRVRYLFHERPGGALRVAAGRRSRSRTGHRDQPVRPVVRDGKGRPHPHGGRRRRLPAAGKRRRRAAEPARPTAADRTVPAVPGGRRISESRRRHVRSAVRHRRTTSRSIFLSRGAFARGSAASRDFDGVFEWTARASRPKVGVTPIALTPVANFEIWSGQDTVYVINDNEGQQFDFEKLAQGETWVTRDALAKIGVNNPRSCAGGATDRRALASVKPTDVLVLGIQTWPVGVSAVPLRVEGRAALYSLGFLLRRAAAVRLDIHERELKVGLRVMQDPNGQVIGQIFISDSLENGAGYSSYFGTPAEAESSPAVRRGPDEQHVLWPARRSDGSQGNPAHGALCRTSCPDCLRDFSNLAYHNILDWRLGLDLARLALDPNAPIDFSVPYWQGLDAAAAGPYFAAHARLAAVDIRRASGRPARKPGRDHHPSALEHGSEYFGPQLAAAYAQAVAAGCQVTMKSIFEVLRRPF